MADTLYIQDLVAQCRIGVFDGEQANPQNVWIDLEVAVDAGKAAARDDVAEATDYATLVSSVKHKIQAKPYRLLETMAEDVAALILTQFAVPQVRVRVKKRALPGIDSAAIEVIRRR